MKNTVQNENGVTKCDGLTDELQDLQELLFASKKSKRDLLSRNTRMTQMAKSKVTL